MLGARFHSLPTGRGGNPSLEPVCVCVPQIWGQPCNANVPCLPFKKNILHSLHPKKVGRVNNFRNLLRLPVRFPSDQVAVWRRKNKSARGARLDRSLGLVHRLLFLQQLGDLLVRQLQAILLPELSHRTDGWFDFWIGGYGSKIKHPDMDHRF